MDERGAREQRALITSYMHHLLPVLLLDQREEQLQEVATCLGISLAQCNVLCAIVPRSPRPVRSFHERDG